jgi:hypothetical protein
MASGNARVSVFEFSDHVRVALQLTYLLATLQPAPRCTLFLRKDCREFMAPSSTLVSEVRYANKYLMTLRFFFEAAILGRKALVSTGPEASAPLIKRVFARLLALLKDRISVFMIVRDLKPERGRFLLPPTLYSRRSVLAVESDALRQACLAAGYAPQGYIYPTPITHEKMPGPRPQPEQRPVPALRTVLLTGSLDAQRRDYDMLLEAIAILKARGIKLRVVVGGHCLTPTAPAVLAQLRQHCEAVTAADLLADTDLDAALLAADAIVCLNRPQFYGGMKGSGAIGDAFFAGMRLLIHAELAQPASADSAFYAVFSDGASLAARLQDTWSNGQSLRLPPHVLEQQIGRFSQLIGRWLQL